MELKDFVANFAAQLDETNPSAISATTEFRNIEEWSSLSALSVIAMVDDEYGVVIKGEDISNSKTVEDIFNIVKSRKV